MRRVVAVTARERIRELTATNLGGLPIGLVVARLNRFLIGWSNYFSTGYPRQAHRKLNRFVDLRLVRHLQRRSQRSLKPPKGMSWYAFIHHRLKVLQL
jgi:RNA-directed DNA polymerase